MEAALTRDYYEPLNPAAISGEWNLWQRLSQWSVSAPRFIFPISASLKRCSVSGCSGALIVTTSQTRTIDSTFGW
jgi:hypothetical protein